MKVVVEKEERKMLREQGYSDSDIDNFRDKLDTYLNAYFYNNIILTPSVMTPEDIIQQIENDTES